jgi:hypothetical protein
MSLVEQPTGRHAADDPAGRSFIPFPSCYFAKKCVRNSYVYEGQIRAHGKFIQYSKIQELISAQWNMATFLYIRGDSHHEKNRKIKSSSTLFTLLRHS